MRITYTWTDRDWREAVALAASRSRSRPILPGYTWALILLPLIGGAGDLIARLRQSGKITLAGSIVPLLLILSALLGGAALLALHRRRRARTRAHMPAGEQEAVFNETGWSIGATASSSSPTGASTAEEPPHPGPRAIQPWDQITLARRSDRVFVLLTHTGFHAIPTRGLTPEQGGHLHRLITRKVRPVKP